MRTYFPVQTSRALLYSLSLLLAAARAVFAAGVVSNATDADLRAALAGGGLVKFAVDGTIVLTNTISIANSTVIDGTGRAVVISGGNAFRVFDVNASGALTVSNLTMANGWGLIAGGFLNNGTLTLISCTISSNTAYSLGTVAGGVLNLGTLFASGCTFVGNVSSTNLSNGALASAIGSHHMLSSGASMWLVNCTFFGNSIPAVSYGGNTIYQSGNKPSLIVNCTIAGWVGYGAGPPNQPGSMTLRNTIAYVAGGDTNSSNNLISSNPGLGPLADNGGPTLTMALLRDSPAINAANAADAPATDQRGFARPYGSGHDIGAVETVFIGTNTGAMRFTSLNYDVLQTNGSATITVYRDHGATGTVSVQFATGDATAIAGQDYTATNGTLTFNSGEISKSFVIHINTQPAALSTKTVNLTLSNPAGGATLGNPSVGNLNILPTARLITSNDETVLRSAMSSGGVLMLAFDGTMTLTSPLIASATVALDASGHSVTISGANLTRLFNVQPGVMLSLNNLTLADGMAHGTNGVAGSNGGPGEGGAIFSDNGIVNARNCSFVRNTARGGDGSPSNGGDGGVGSGGALYLNGGAFRATNCVFTVNSVLGGTGGPGGTAPDLPTFTTGGGASGGFICNRGGMVQLANSIIASNTAVAGEGRRQTVGPGSAFGGESSGGAVYTTTGEVWLVRCVISANSGKGGKTKNASGGAIYQRGGELHVVESLMNSNKVAGGAGVQGAFMSEFPAGAAYGGAVSITAGAIWLTNSTLSSNLVVGGAGSSYGNVGSGFGGGVFSSGTLQAVNSTIVVNTARSGTPGSPTATQGSGLGGGLYNEGGSVALNYVTISGNSAEQITGGTPGTGSAAGGGIYSTTGTVTLHGTIAANSLSGSNAFGSLMDGGYNLSSDSSCNFTNTGSLNDTDPRLGPFGDYGGPTPTMPLLNGSPAIDGGDDAACPSTDQRGRARPYGAACDMGAFESSPPFVIRGRVTGFTFWDDVNITAGLVTTMTTNRDSYSLEGLAASTYTVTPSHSNYLFIPNNRAATTGPDQLNIDFKAYHWNALSIEGVSNGVLHLAYAGTNGQTYRVLASSNLTDWIPISTDTVGSSHLSDIFDATGQRARFYRLQWP